jgi:hypothetical protein
LKILERRLLLLSISHDAFLALDRLQVLVDEHLQDNLHETTFGLCCFGNPKISFLELFTIFLHSLLQIIACSLLQNRPVGPHLSLQLRTGREEEGLDDFSITAAKNINFLKKLLNRILEKNENCALETCMMGSL